MARIGVAIHDVAIRVSKCRRVALVIPNRRFRPPIKLRRGIDATAGMNSHRGLCRQEKAVRKCKNVILIVRNRPSSHINGFLIEIAECKVLVIKVARSASTEGPVVKGSNEPDRDWNGQIECLYQKHPPNEQQSHPHSNDKTAPQKAIHQKPQIPPRSTFGSTGLSRVQTTALQRAPVQPLLLSRAKSLYYAHLQ